MNNGRIRAEGRSAELPRGLRRAVVGDGRVSPASAGGEHRDHKHALACLRATSR